MKKLFVIILLFSGVAFAALDTDSDGVSDEVDVCPRVYARSANGCPTLSAPINISLNTCISDQILAWKIVALVTPICDTKTQSCPKITKVTGLQSCDPVFPVIFDKNNNPLIRWSVFIVDFTK